jgi:methylmalonyl-CoA mutase cobalamin-binding subunit
MAGYTESIGFAGLQAAGVDRDAALVGGVLAAATASVAKEFADRRAYGLFSVGDLVWDALGASAAMLILRKTTR